MSERSQATRPEATRERWSRNRDATLTKLEQLSHARDSTYQEVCAHLELLGGSLGLQNEVRAMLLEKDNEWVALVLSVANIDPEQWHEFEVREAASRAEREAAWLHHQLGDRPTR